MTYQKRRSVILEKALARLRGLQSLHPTMDLGDGLTLQNYADLIEASNTQLQAYHLTLAEADRARLEFAESEASVSAISSRILSAIVARYGRDSKEYELAGGKPPSNSKRAKKLGIGTSPSEVQSAENLPSTTSSNGAVVNGATIAS